jgi:hypothetical protein
MQQFFAKRILVALSISLPFNKIEKYTIRALSLPLSFMTGRRETAAYGERARSLCDASMSHTAI